MLQDIENAPLFGSLLAIYVVGECVGSIVVGETYSHPCLHFVELISDSSVL